MGLDPTKIVENSMELKVGDKTYEIPLKEKKVPVSFRVLPGALRVIDKLCVIVGRSSRSKLLERIVEILALLVLSTKYNVKSITIVVVDKDGTPHQGSIVIIPPDS